MKTLQMVLIWTFALASEPSELDRSLRVFKKKIPPPPPDYYSSSNSSDPNSALKTSYETLYARKQFADYMAGVASDLSAYDAYVGL